MSEYQYYEFLAIDRPLTPEEQAKVGKLSSRAEPTATRVVFTYSYSDFRHDPIEVLATYFDALLYMANWGSRQLAFRFPLSAMDPEWLKPYCVGDVVTASVHDDYVVLDFDFSQLEASGWIEEEVEWLPRLVPLRRDLLHGDFRALYLLWLHALRYTQETEIGDDALEPPVPAGLNKLSPALEALVDFFEIDDDELSVAAGNSPKASSSVKADPEKLIPRLPEEERNALLLRVARGKPHVDLLLNNRLDELVRADLKLPIFAPPRRTVGQLLKTVEDRPLQPSIDHEHPFGPVDQLAPLEPYLWMNVRSLIEEKKSRSYDEAVKIL